MLKVFNFSRAVLEPSLRFCKSHSTGRMLSISET
jgi:hypothetical protein